MVTQGLHDRLLDRQTFQLSRVSRCFAQKPWSDYIATITSQALISNTMSITSGNIGDIIAVGRVAWELARALTGRGSAKEYQGLVKELEVFDKALLEVSYKICKSIALLLID